MEANCSSGQEKEGPTWPKEEEKKDCKQDNKSTKLQFRHLSDQMLEKYRRLSEDSDLNQSQYEEAALKVYGTPPARQLSSFQREKKKNEEQKK